MSQRSVASAIAHNKPPEILSLIGDTPLVEVTQFDTGPCQLFLKLENQNPGGSIKDRIALSMIEAAEAEGKLQPGGTVIEATAGNTGLGLALVAGAKALREAGATKVYACATHGLFNGDALDRTAASDIHKLVVTDTVPLDPLRQPENVQVLSIAGILGERRPPGPASVYSTSTSWKWDSPLSSA